MAPGTCSVDQISPLSERLSHKKIALEAKAEPIMRSKAIYGTVNI